MHTEIDTFVSPFSDLCFKYLFSKEIVLEDFVNSFFEFVGKNYKFKFTYVKAEDSMNPSNKDLKTYLGDLVAVLNDDIIIDLEAYTSFEKKSFNKSFAYATRLYNENILDTKTYKSHPIISINIMTGNYKRMNSKLVNTYMFTNVDSNKNITQNIILYLVRIDIISRVSYNESEKRFITWLRFINSKSIEDMEELVKMMKGDYVMTQAMEFVKEWNKKSAENGFERILNDKYYDGVDDGKDIGIKIGKTEGILETARNFLKIGISVEDVVKATNLSKAKIKSIQKQIELES